jgi:hypothetical protein
MSAKCQERKFQSRLMPEVVSLEKRHHCIGHRRDKLLFASIYCERLPLTDSNSSTRFHHFAPKYKTPTARWREQVYFEFDREHSRIIRHKRERRVAAGTVERGRYDTGMYETVMLSIRRGVGHYQFDFSWLYVHDFDAERFHYLLLIKACLDA